MPLHKLTKTIKTQNAVLLVTFIALISGMYIITDFRITNSRLTVQTYEDTINRLTEVLEDEKIKSQGCSNQVDVLLNTMNQHQSSISTIPTAISELAGVIKQYTLSINDKVKNLHSDVSRLNDTMETIDYKTTEHINRDE